jgi:hypothetical protein
MITIAVIASIVLGQRDSESAAKVIKKGELRWSVKTGSDPQAKDVNMSPEDITPALFTAFPRPQEFPASLRPMNGKFDQIRFAPYELQVYRIHAKLVQFKEEADGDFHCAMEGDDGTPFVAEVTKPDFASSRGSGATQSIWLPQIQSVRAQFLRTFGIAERTTPQNGFKNAGTWVTLTGPAYFDDDEKQNHMAANVIEIHPILGMVFDPTSQASQQTKRSRK